MSKQSLLLVDHDTRSMRVLEVSLRKAGFSVTTATSVQDALDKLELDAPELIISETTFPDGDGFELRRRVRSSPDWDEIPFIFLTAEAAIENKIRGLELGVDDYLTKPIYIKEIVTRINILLQKRQRVRFEERRPDGRTRFTGRVADMPVVDVIQTIEISRKSGVIQFVGDRGRQAAIYFREGRVIDAEAGALQGEDAVYRLLTWSEGEFEVVFRTVRRREVITMSSQALLMEGMRRLDEWSRLLDLIPPLTHRFEVDAGELSTRLGDVPDDNNSILRLIDGKRTLLEVIDSSDVGDLECLQAISRLYFEEMLTDIDHTAPARRDTGKSMPLVEVPETPTPIEDAVSGPIEDTTDHDPDVIDEAPGALMGGYRPSSLMLIDAAVAAAQAIEPGLFEDEIDRLSRPTDPPPLGDKPMGTPPFPATFTPAPPANGATESAAPISWEKEESVPVAIESDEPATPPSRPRPPKPVEPPVEPIRGEESGLRMIGSLGRDRAEASGELSPIGSGPPPLSTTQRELVTILPRRITRELATIPAPEPAPPEPPKAKPIEPPSRASTPPTQRTVGSGVRRRSGPSFGAILLFALAAVLAGVAVYMRLHKSKSHEPPVQDAAAIVTPLAADAGLPIDAPDVLDAPIATVDAGVRVDAAPLTPDGGTTAALDPAKQAKTLMQEANGAIDEGDFEKALRLANASLKLRHTARAYLVRAQAQQRLGNVEEALGSIDEAEKLSPNFPTVFELRGRILWAARQFDEARAAFEKFLELSPNGATAAQIRQLLNRPQ